MKVSIVGAGELGATAACKLAEKDLCKEILLYDTAEGLAQGKCLDILQSSPLLGFRTKFVGTENIERLADSDAIVLSEDFRTTAHDFDEERASRFLQRLARLKDNSVLIAAENSSVPILERAIHRAGYSPQKVVGSAPLALTSAITYAIAREIGCSHRDITLPLLGLPPKDLVIPWSLASVSGTPLNHLLAASTIRRIYDKIKTVWPLGPCVLASAACEVCHDVLENRGTTRSCFVLLRGEYNYKNIFSIAPARIGRPGVLSIHEIPLDPVYKVALENAYKSGGLYEARIS